MISENYKRVAATSMLERWNSDMDPLKDMKESHTVQVSQYEKALGIDDMPAFAWWVPYTLRKRDVIISSLKGRMKITHKYGIKIPRGIYHAYSIDAEEGTSCCYDEIKKEMKDVDIAFDILESNRVMPVGWRIVTGHLIFDIKMDFNIYLFNSWISSYYGLLPKAL